MIDVLGRCCFRKPLTYKREGKFYCTRCSRAYDINTKEQIANWAWRRNADSGEWEPVFKKRGLTGEYARCAAVEKMTRLQVEHRLAELQQEMRTASDYEKLCAYDEVAVLKHAIKEKQA